MEILYPTASVFIFFMSGILLFSFFLIISWIGMRLIATPIKIFWYAIKNLIDNT